MACSQSVYYEKHDENLLRIFEQGIEGPDHHVSKNDRIAKSHVGVYVSSDALIDIERQRYNNEAQESEAEQRSYDADVGKKKVLAEVGDETVLPHQ